MRSWLGSFKQLADRITFREGGLTGKPDPAPIHVPGRSPTVLAVHGYCGVPREVRVVCEAAASRGLAATAPLLAGHGTSPSDLAPLGFSDWMQSLRAPFAAAAAGGPVVVAGLSLGSLLALRLALDSPERVAGLVLLGNALWLAEPYPGLALRLARALGGSHFGLPKYAAGLTCPVARADHTSYASQPVRGAVELQKAAIDLRGRLSKISCPALILHGARDRSCPVSNAWRAAESLGSKDVEVRIFPRSAHVLTRDIERDQVRAAIASFLRRWDS